MSPSEGTDRRHDLFSREPAAYARFRPTYPDALFDYLTGLVPSRETAWDCATGNGQAAVAVASRFGLVIATDVSLAQLSQAPAHPRIRYHVATAERSGLTNDSVDLVTVAQAMHWFDVTAFHREVHRVARQEAVVAAWGYRLPSVDRDVDVVLERFVAEIASFWPPERRHVESSYRELEWPYARIAAPRFEMSASLDLDGLLGYIATWTAVSRFRDHRGHDPIPGLRDAAIASWGRPARRRIVRWPMFVHVGRVGV